MIRKAISDVTEEVSAFGFSIEQYTRQEDGLWLLRDYESSDDVLNIPSIGVSLPLARIHNRIEIPATERSRSLRDRQIS